jgi:GntR family transcriptional regulator
VANGADTRQVDHSSDRPVYKQIADILRAEIDAGVHQPGDKLPSESQLMAWAQVSRETVRRAVEILRLEGRVRPQRGRGVYVQREIRPVIARNSERLLRRRRMDDGLAPLKVDEEISKVKIDHEVVELAEVPAPATIAEHLDVPPRQMVFVRRRIVRYHDGPPLQLADSYLPLDIAVRRIRDTESGDGGIYRRIEEDGHRLTHFSEQLSFRMPTRDEKRNLQLDDGVPVVKFVRVAYTVDRPVECFVAVMAGDKHRFEYEIEAER